MWSLFQFFDDDCILGILDVGAARAGSAAYRKLVDANRARLTAFEPNPFEADRLREVFGTPHRIFPIALGDGNPGTIRQTTWNESGSLLEPNLALMNRFADSVSLLSEIPVRTTRLDDIPELGEVDYVRIDTQGSELDVLRNAASVLAQAVVIETEVSIVEVHRRQPLFADLDIFLRASGFQLHSIDRFNARCFRSTPWRLPLPGHQLLWGDAIYVRDWMRLDLLPPEKLRRYAVLAHDLFDSYDLAHTVLVEHDRQTGQSLAGRYLKRLARAESRISAGLGTDTGADGPAQNDMPIRPDESSGENWVGNDALRLETAQGHLFSVPADLGCISTYVLLEQERWFELEPRFLDRFLQKGMTVIDIGANIGLYAVQMAKAVGPSGRVVAYEPGSANRFHLGRNVRLNRLANVQVSPCALSSRSGSAAMRIAYSGELDTLVDAASAPGTSETVRVTTLDALMASEEWTSVDFVKIDAEGQEARIVAGGRNFFSEFSPLVMYEAKHGDSAHGVNLRWAFEALGYATYRLLGDASVLVPVPDTYLPDDFQLNLFAAKPERAKLLAASGLLVLDGIEPTLTASERSQALGQMLKQPFARSFDIGQEDIAQCPFAEALVSYAAYRYLEGISPRRRYALLAGAFNGLKEYCAGEASPAAASTFARIANDLGYRAAAVEILKPMTETTCIEIDQPFFPAAARFEAVEVGDTPEKWFRAAAIEQFELSRAWSSQFRGDLHLLMWLCASAYRSAETCRRAILLGMILGLPRRDIVRGLAALQDLQVLNRSVWHKSADDLYSLWNN